MRNVMGNLTFHIGRTCPNYPAVPDPTDVTLAAIHIYGMRDKDLVKISRMDALDRLT
jgi:hypothetical protein